MDEQKKYNPKYTREPKPWDDSCWQTGCTEPPKNRGGLIALMLILIIFLCGIITVMGILNIRLFQQLQIQDENDMSISFTIQETFPAATAPMTIDDAVPAETGDSASMKLQQSSQSLDNIPDAAGMSLQDIYTQSIPSVVSISCTLPRGNSTGTGVILTEDGYIVTNAHVVEDAISVTVQLTDDRSFSADLIGADEVTDLAVLRIHGEDLIPAQFGDSSMLRVGDTVVAIGDPLGVKFRGTYTDGIVSAINRNVDIEGRTMTLIQTNAALNSGNSGGPLINCYGQVIGINTMKIGAFADSAGVEGLGFAIPSVTVKDVVDQLIAQGYVSGRPTLGLVGETLSTFYQHYYRLPAGLYITGVERSSDAFAKGIEEGDILISLGGRKITTMEEMNAILQEQEVGKSMEAVFYRRGQQYVLQLTLTEDKG